MNLHIPFMNNCPDEYTLHTMEIHRYGAHTLEVNAAAAASLYYTRVLR